MDGNGVLTRNELQFFYEEQLHRMECMAQEPVLFEDILCQIIDMIGPEVSYFFFYVFLDFHFSFFIYCVYGTLELFLSLNVLYWQSIYFLSSLFIIPFLNMYCCLTISVKLTSSRFYSFKESYAVCIFSMMEKGEITYINHDTLHDKG